MSNDVDPTTAEPTDYEIEVAEIVEEDDSDSPDRKHDNPWVLLGTLFFVTAALGLPFLWMSRAFSTWMKVVLSIVVIIYTILILWGFTLVMIACWESISDSLEQMR